MEKKSAVDHITIALKIVELLKKNTEINLFPSCFSAQLQGGCKK